MIQHGRQEHADKLALLPFMRRASTTSTVRAIASRAAHATSPPWIGRRGYAVAGADHGRDIGIVETAYCMISSVSLRGPPPLRVLGANPSPSTPLDPLDPLDPRPSTPLNSPAMPVNMKADEQLTLALSWLSETEFLAAMRQRGATELTRVRFRPNRTRLVSLSADRSSLNVHTAFRAAPGDVLDAIAVFATAVRAGAGYRRAIRRLRSWWERQTEDGVDQPAARMECCGTSAQRVFLAAAFAHLNQRHFGGALPADIPLRLSARMSRRFGHIHYGRSRIERSVDEIALNVELMLPGNEAHFVDTLLHEMAHAEAWLVHGHRGHGRAWRTIAERVGCRPRACSDVRLRRRRRGTVSTVPDLRLV